MKEKPICKLTGGNGNIFNIIGRVSKTLKKAGFFDEAKEFQQKAFASKSYDDFAFKVVEYQKSVVFFLYFEGQK
jgi:hypothetical protein